MGNIIFGSPPATNDMDHAIQDLIKSCRGQLPDGSSSQSQSLRFIDVQNACDELLNLTFYSEDAKLQVIGKLTELEGNFVVKIIRNGLVSLSKVYSDCKTFEEESLKLVDLCCSQTESLKNGCGQQLASPSVIIDWTVALCDELLKPKEVCIRHLSTVLLSRCLSRLRDIYEVIVRARIYLFPVETSGTPILGIETFKVLFETLKTRIQDEGFEELIEQTVAIVKREENLDFFKLSQINAGFKHAVILSRWEYLLKVSFLPNWFAVEVAKHDFLVHDDSYAPSLPFMDVMTYDKSLVCKVVALRREYMSSLLEQKEFFCSKDKAEVFFEYSEVFQRHTLLCLQLMQSKEIGTNLIKNIFFTLGIKIDRALLPVPANSNLEDCDFEISPDISAMFAQMKSLEEKQSRSSIHNMLQDFHEKSSFAAITKALLTLSDKQQVLTVVQIWKQNFPDDKSYLMLSQLLELVQVVIEGTGTEESRSRNMEQLVIFLSHLPSDCLSKLSLWQPLMVHLIPSLPLSWYGPEVRSLISVFLDLHIRNTINTANGCSSGVVDKLLQFPNFVMNSQNSTSKSEEVKIKALQLALELSEEVPDPQEYEFALDVIHAVASDMEASGIKTFTLSLLKTARVHIAKIQYPEILQVISLIDKSGRIERKGEVFESYLRLLREVNHDDVIGVITACSSLLHLPVAVDTDNVKRFFVLAATDGRLKTCQFILKCLYFNQKLLAEDSRVDKHITCLFSITERTLSRESRELFFETVFRYMQLQVLSFPSIDVFEVMLASIAGCIAVNTFNSYRFETVLRVVVAAVLAHQMDQPNASDVLPLLIHLAQIIDKAQRFGKKEGFADVFARGLCPVAKLPLTIPKIVQLMERVTAILAQEKITNNQKLFNVMFHLFQLPINESASSLDSEVLDLHFKEIVKPGIIRNVAEIPLMGKHDITGTTSLFSLMEMLVERMPETFANGRTSSGLCQFIIKRVERNPQLSCSIFPVVEAITKRRVSEAKLKEEVEEIEEMLLRVPQGFVPLIGECLRQCYEVGLSGDEQSIKCLIMQIFEYLGQSDMNVDDGCRMVDSILGIPKQLVLTFKAATTTDEAREGMTRVFDVVRALDPGFMAGSFLSVCFPQEVNEQLKTIIQHDFYMLLKHTSLVAIDLCTAMLVYRSLKPECLLNVLRLSTNQDFKSVFEQWFSGTNQPEFPTPGNLAYLVIQHLRRLNMPDNDIQKTTLEICCTILSNRCFSQPMMPVMGIWGSPSPKEYLNLIISVMKESSHLAEIKHWLKIDCLLAVQCKDVIREACLWKAGSKSCEEALHMNTAVSKTLSVLMSNKVAVNALSLIKASLSKELEVMVLVLKTYEDKDIAVKLFELLCISTHCAEACVEVVLSWSKEESLLLINKITNWYKGKMETEPNQLEQFNNEIRIPLQVLQFAAKAFPNSAEDVFNFLTKTKEENGPDDPTSLGRLPVWYKKMTDAGYDPQAIQSWCTSFVFAQKLFSTDVDSLANLTPEMITLLTAEPESNQIKKCLFCLQATQHLQTNNDAFKRCLLLARLLNEFACIAGQLRENTQVVRRIQKGVGELCLTFLDNANAMGKLYKIRYNILYDLFVLLFGGGNREHVVSLRQLTSQEKLSKSLVILFRRLARSVVSRPITFGHVKSVVTSMLQHKDKNPNCQDQEIINAIHLEVLHFDSNQDAIHTLQAAGYNQSAATNENLWYSSSIQMSAYVPTVKSFELSRKESLLRQLWREWKTVLTAHDISEVEVSGNKLKQVELFKISDSLEAMEIQLQSVQQAIQSKPLMQNNWSYYRQRELLRNEKRLRKEIAKQVKEVEKTTGTHKMTKMVKKTTGTHKMTKMVLVWDNQLLESVKMCSEKIPDCYAPNGFHSEKPVICGIAVDNRILTLYKEDEGGKRTRTELENVEVKLYPAGMVAFGAYRSIHPYDTDQLWAAFYKMLLDKRLVPKIFITNVSPAFDWIKKFVTPEVSPPHGINFLSCCNLIPSSEDSFDYEPERELLASHAVLNSSQTKELIILTLEKAAKLKIKSIKPLNRSQLIRDNIDKSVLHLREDGRLKEMHPKSHDKILDRLKFAIRHAVEIAVDGGKPTKKSISRIIEKKRLLFGCQDTHQYSKKRYSAVVLDAVNTVTGDLRDSRKTFDGCQHVEFLQQMK